MSSEIVYDHEAREIRLTDERWQHIVSHPEMINQRERLLETISEPDSVVQTAADTSIHVYQRFYDHTPVTSKFMLVAVKMLEGNAFIVTAFYSRRSKKGDVVWQK